MAVALFDAAVLSGPQNAVKQVQQAIGVKADGRLEAKTLKRMDDNRSKTARALGVRVRTIRNKLRQYREAGEAEESS